MTNAVVIPCCIRMKDWGRGFELIIAEPLKGLTSGDDVADATIMNQALESMIRRFPEQYMWLHPRFKHRPPGAPNFYG